MTNSSVVGRFMFYVTMSYMCEFMFNPYSPNVTFLYPQKKSENQRFSDVFSGYRNVTLGEYGLMNGFQVASTVHFPTLTARNVYLWNQIQLNFHDLETWSEIY